MIEIKDFNPRSLAGATGYPVCREGGRQISIHAPSRERLMITSWQNMRLGISIHAPSRERLGADFLIMLVRQISIHAPSRERPYG